MSQRQSSNSLAPTVRRDIGEDTDPRIYRRTASRHDGKKKGDVSPLRTIIEEAAATLVTNYPNRYAEADICTLLRNATGDIANAVGKMKRADEAQGTEWSETDMMNAFYSAFIKYGQAALITTYGDLGERLMTASGGSTGYGTGASSIMDTSGGSDPGGGYGGGGISQSAGAGGTLMLHLRSCDRESWSGSLPNVCRFSLGSVDGVAYYNHSVSQILRIVLRSVGINAAPLFTERTDGATFYVGIDEVTNDFNRESALNDTRGHFVCFAEANGRRSGLRVRIETGTIDLPITSLSLSVMTIRFFDDIKRPLVLEQDLYAITGYAWDDTNERLLLEVGQHSIRSGDRIVIRNYYFSQDRTLLDDSKNFRAEVVSNTFIAVYAWRAALPPGTPPEFIPPEGDRTPTADAPYIIDLNNVVSVTLGVDFIRS